MSSICRICLSENNEKDDPLISPCKCAGSLQYVHLKCLQEWVKSRLNLLENKNMILTITWKNLNCELCKSLLPFSVKHNGEEFSLLGFDNKYTKYMILESFSKEKQPTAMHIIDITQPHKFYMGRGHHCDLKISDISVSRVHAFISQVKGRVCLEDNDSKFGTLVLRKDSIVFPENNTQAVVIQNGRTLLKFSLKRPWLSFVPCIGSLFRSTTTTSKVTKKREPEAKVEKEEFFQVNLDESSLPNEENDILKPNDDILKPNEDK